MAIVRGTCAAFGNAGVLIEGPPGSGKSDLALRLMDRGWTLVSDDYTEVEARRGRLYARAPKAIAGKMEVRGLGIQHLGTAKAVPVRLLVRLVPRGEVPRFPAPARRTIAGLAIPARKLHAFDASTPIKIELALKGR